MIVLLYTILLHAQMALPAMGSTQGSPVATVASFQPVVLEPGKPLVLKAGTKPLVLE